MRATQNLDHIAQLLKTSNKFPMTSTFRFHLFKNLMYDATDVPCFATVARCESSSTVYVARCVYLLYLHPAAKFPGPRLATVSNIPYVYHWLRGRWPWAVEDMVKKHGNVVRVAPNEIVFATSQAAHDIYEAATKHQEDWVKTDLMDFGSKDGGFLWEQDAAKRKEVAKKLLPAFSHKAIRAKEPTVHHHIDLFVNKMKGIGHSAEGIDLNTWLLWFAMDMSADLAYSRELHQMRDESSSDFMETMLGTNFFGTVMQLSKKIPILTPLAYLRRIDNHGKTRHPDLLDYMLPADPAKPIDQRGKVHIEQVAFQLLMAGFDPVQLTLYSSLFLLMKTPETLKILTREIRTAFDIYDEITADSLASIPYLNACIHETLRVHVPGATGGPRISPGAVVDGIYVPKGVVCQVSLFTIARHPQNFHDPLSFRPARWLSSDHPQYDSRFSNDNLKVLFPFGLGPRACLGREIAWSQCRLFLAKVLWTFDLTLTHGENFAFDADFSTHVMWYKPPLRVRFSQR
ncbi:cytochrome P450 [Xylariaceae sp. FL1019]|nr:cytochrome P450 [Xylariaceae sp. FL1019]